MTFESIYETQVSAIGGRNGQAISKDGKLDIILTMPKVLGGTLSQSGTNPEQLFAACFGASFGASLQALAKVQTIELGELSVQVTITLGRLTDNGFRIQLLLVIEATQASLPDLQALVKDTFEVCTYAKAIRGNVDITWKADQRTQASDIL